MKRSIVIGLSALGCFVVCAVIYAQVASNSVSSLPSVEVNARFASADQNGDGSLSKEEFATYFAQFQRVKHSANAVAKNDEAKSDCCGGKDKAKNAVAKDAEKSCCSEGKNAETVSVKFSKEGEVQKDAKKGGCCGGKDKAKSADAKDSTAKSGAEKSCCSEGKNAETVNVKFSKEGEVQKDAKKGGCCGGKDKAKSADAKDSTTKNADSKTEDVKTVDSKTD
ncbi:MAG: hypothetical protein LBB88_01860, partial [Planctomycetaceae bacterium]|nr:hypothetical protein [Planctomycetaceae bacterium]